MARNLNKFMFSGNLTRDAELSFTPQGTAVAKFSVAVNRYKQGEVDFFDCTCWVKNLSEIIGAKAKKGDEVIVGGKIETYTKADGGKGFKVVVDDFIWTRGSRRKEDGEEHGQY